MQRYIYQARIDRIRRLSKILTFGGLGLVVVALLLSLSDPQLLGMALGLSLAGLLSSQLGTVMMRRWPDRGRSDQLLDAALKGLDGRHILIHYLTRARHGLLTPRGVVALVPVGDSGRITLRDGVVWRTPIKRDGSPGRPSPLRGLTEQAAREAEVLRQAILRRSPEAEVEVTPLLVFVHPEARLEFEDQAVPAVHLKKLKDYLRHLPRRTPLNERTTSDLTDGMAEHRVR
jgi:hypothetical protein